MSGADLRNYAVLQKLSYHCKLIQWMYICMYIKYVIQHRLDQNYKQIFFSVWRKLIPIPYHMSTNYICQTTQLTDKNTWEGNWESECTHTRMQVCILLYISWHMYIHTCICICHCIVANCAENYKLFNISLITLIAMRVFVVNEK